MRSTGVPTCSHRRLPQSSITRSTTSFTSASVAIGPYTPSVLRATAKLYHAA